jgi:hypothetical protein
MMLWHMVHLWKSLVHGVERKVCPWSFLDCSAPLFRLDVRGNLLDGLSGKYSNYSISFIPVNTL